MPISKQGLEDACRKASRELVFNSDGWLDDITAVIASLKAPAMANSPIAAEKLALLNTFISVTDRLLDLRKIGKVSNGPLPDALNNPAKIFVLAVKLCLEHVKSRIENQLINIEQILASGRHYDKTIFTDAFRQSAKEIVSNSGDSFLSKVIVPGVLFAGEKRLADIKNIEVAEFYCNRLLYGAKIFDIYDTTPDRPYSIEQILTQTYKTMLERVQDIYFVLNQPKGLEKIVYVQPRLALIKRCITQYEKYMCGSSAKTESIATRNFVSKRAKVLYLYAWNLQVTTADTLVIRVLQNPQSALQTIDSGVFYNMLARFEGLVSPTVEQIAWNETVSAMG